MHFFDAKGDIDLFGAPASLSSSKKSSEDACQDVFCQFSSGDIDVFSDVYPKITDNTSKSRRMTWALPNRAARFASEGVEAV